MTASLLVRRNQHRKPLFTPQPRRPRLRRMCGCRGPALLDMNGALYCGCGVPLAREAA